MAQHDLGPAEKAALHELQLGIEDLYRAYGKFLEFHHGIGHAMDRFATAERVLRETGYTEFADELRDHQLPAGVVGDKWTYELVEEFKRGFLADADGFEQRVCRELAGGVDHVSERELQSYWRANANPRA
ncbi:hypothetical protein [Haladaptatus sp. ZSTT2]|uniref:hypothetical protein n=1 Tax=Haladaptatus sp. ZSTT2 TaxID=3120515 RepID=UPI00300E8EE7